MQIGSRKATVKIETAGGTTVAQLRARGERWFIANAIESAFNNPEAERVFVLDPTNDRLSMPTVGDTFYCTNAKTRMYLGRWEVRHLPDTNAQFVGRLTRWTVVHIPTDAPIEPAESAGAESVRSAASVGSLIVATVGRQSARLTEPVEPTGPAEPVKSNAPKPTVPTGRPAARRGR